MNESVLSARMPCNAPPFKLCMYPAEDDGTPFGEDVNSEEEDDDMDEGEEDEEDMMPPIPLTTLLIPPVPMVPLPLTAPVEEDDKEDAEPEEETVEVGEVMLVEGRAPPLLMRSVKR